VLDVARLALWLLLVVGHNALPLSLRWGGNFELVRRCGVWLWLGVPAMLAPRRFMAVVLCAHGAVARAHDGGAPTAMMMCVLGDRVSMPFGAWRVRSLLVVGCAFTCGCVRFLRWAVLFAPTIAVVSPAALHLQRG